MTKHHTLLACTALALATASFATFAQVPGPRPQGGNGNMPGGMSGITPGGHVTGSQTGGRLEALVDGSFQCTAFYQVNGKNRQTPYPIAGVPECNREETCKQIAAQCNQTGPLDVDGLNAILNQMRNQKCPGANSGGGILGFLGL